MLIFKHKKNKANSTVTTRANEPLIVLDGVPIFSKETLDDFRSNVGRFRPESGGMIGCSSDFNNIDLWVFDTTSKNTAGSFAYDEKEMTKYYYKWKEIGGTVTGFVHSHPFGYKEPSDADIRTSLVLMDFFKNDFFYLPIIQPAKNGNYELLFYIVRKVQNKLILEHPYTLHATNIGYEYSEGKHKATFLDINDYVSQPDYNRAHVGSVINHNEGSNASGYFARLKNFYPDSVLEKVLVYVGCGGVRSEIINMARNGFKNFILIDGDKVADTNIATQGVYRSEIGMSKVDAIASELKAINPDVNVICVPKMLDDDISDEEFKSFLDEFKDKQATDYLIHGMTDDHNAQVRIAKLAMNLGIPYIGAAMYQYGLGGEIIFTYPGVTRSCPRCMLRTRYEAYENGFINNVTSEGCPTFATERLNTTIGFISLMLLMYKSAPNSPYNKMLDAVADRNYVQIRMSPIIEEMLNIPTFNMAFSGHDSQFLFFDETIWVPQHPDHPDYGEETCKLCKGTGDLTSLIGKWKDTRAS